MNNLGVREGRKPYVSAIQLPMEANNQKNIYKLPITEIKCNTLHHLSNDSFLFTHVTVFVTTHYYWVVNKRIWGILGNWHQVMYIIYIYIFLFYKTRTLKLKSQNSYLCTIKLEKFNSESYAIWNLRTQESKLQLLLFS